MIIFLNENNNNNNNENMTHQKHRDDVCWSHSAASSTPCPLRRQFAILEAANVWPRLHVGQWVCKKFAQSFGIVYLYLECHQIVWLIGRLRLNYMIFISATYECTIILVKNWSIPQNDTFLRTINLIMAILQIIACDQRSD